MKRSSVEQWIENVGETGCLEPAFKQNTNDDDVWVQSFEFRDENLCLMPYQINLKFEIFFNQFWWNKILLSLKKLK